MLLEENLKQYITLQLSKHQSNTIHMLKKFSLSLPDVNYYLLSESSKKQKKRTK
jgi:hypothetical protein